MLMTAVERSNRKDVQVSLALTSKHRANFQHPHLYKAVRCLAISAGMQGKFMPLSTVATS